MDKEPTRNAQSFTQNYYGVAAEVAKAYTGSLRKHIEFVQEAGAKIGVPEKQLITHDASKWSEEEFPGYARHFHGGGDPSGFAKAWLHHLHRNEHHWQHWMFPDCFPIKGSGAVNGCMEMPVEYILEMVADWMGASMAYTGSWNMAGWLNDNLPKISLHPNSARRLQSVLERIGYGELTYPFLKIKMATSYDEVEVLHQQDLQVYTDAMHEAATARDPLAYQQAQKAFMKAYSELSRRYGPTRFIMSLNLGRCNEY